MENCTSPEAWSETQSGSAQRDPRFQRRIRGGGRDCSSPSRLEETRESFYPCPKCASSPPTQDLPFPRHSRVPDILSSWLLSEWLANWLVDERPPTPLS